MSTTYVPKITAPAYDEDARLTVAILRSPRLLAAFSEELTELFAAHERAVQASDEARRLPAPETNIAAEAEAAIAAGKPVDVAELADRIGEAEVAKQRRAAAVTLIAGLPAVFEQRIIRHVVAEVDAAYDTLSEQLVELLDGAAAAAADLGSVSTAADAIAAGKAASWAAIMTAAKENAALRADHLVLLRGEDSVGFSNGAAKIAFAFYGGLRSVRPDYSSETAAGERDLTGRLHAHEFDPLDVGSAEHMLYVLRNRETLLPHVARPDDATAAATTEPLIGAGAQFAPRGLSREPSLMEIQHGGELPTLARQGARGRSFPPPTAPGPFDKEWDEF